jgi:hypothetical protein
MRQYLVYANFLASDEWNRFTHALIDAGAKCLGCGTRKTLQFHHLNYDRVGRETANDLIPLCRNCHERVHRFLDRQFPRARRWAHARFTERFWSEIFPETQSLAQIMVDSGYRALFGCVHPDRRPKKPSKKMAAKRRKRERALTAMRRDRAFHERMCHR